MSKQRPFSLLFIFALILAACSSSGPIQPGDEVGGFKITQGGEASRSYWANEGDCTDIDPQGSYICSIPAGQVVNISYGIYGKGGETVGEAWDKHTYTLTIDERPVDLAAFGAIDLMNPRVGPMRYWNIAISANQAAKLVVHFNVTVDEDSLEETITYITP